MILVVYYDKLPLGLQKNSGKVVFEIIIKAIQMTLKLLFSMFVIMYAQTMYPQIKNIFFLFLSLES